VSVFAAHSAVEPAPRGDQWWKDRQESFNKRVAEVGEKAQVIFIGDSITQGWEGAGKQTWAENFAKYDAVNLGIGGDRTQHVLWRLENGNLKGIKPKAAVVMIGTNNSNGEDNSVEQIADGVRAIVEKLRSVLPETKVLLVAIFPRGENPNPQRGKILQVNQIIRRLADGQNVVWVDFGQKYIDDQGRIPREIMPDYLHLSEQGYQIWAESIKRPLERALGAGPGQGQRRNRGQAQAAVEKPAAVDMAGQWVATLPGPNNEPVDVPFTLTKEGDKLAGNFHAEGRDLPIREAKVEGNEFSWTVKRNRPDGGSLTYKMWGSVEANGAIKGKASTDLEGNEITIDWTAKKK
jgi:beta-glucosidase